MNEHMIEVIVAMVVAGLSSSGLWAYLSDRRNKLAIGLQEDAAFDQNVKALVISLARIQLVEVCLKYIERGSISMEEADMITSLYEPYEALGGNGNGKRLYHQAMNLPRKNSRVPEESLQVQEET